MPTGPQITLIGNCQVTPLSTLLKTIYQVETIKLISAHLVQDKDAEHVSSIIDQADIVITQHIHDLFPKQYLHTSRLKQSCKQRLLTIPNLFYRGYTPDLRYVRLKHGSTLPEPLGDYHSRILLESWQKGCNNTTLESLYRDPELWKQRYEHTARDSINELKKRELQLDIKISNFIASKQSTNRLFHTFNHPGKTLLTRLAKRIGKALGLTPKSNFKRELQGISDTLNRIQIPIHPFTQHNLGLKFSSTEHIQSDHINGVILKQPQQFTLLELIQQFSLFYSSHPALMRDIKD